LLFRFGLISALAIAAVGVVLVAELRSAISGQAIDEGRTIATLAARLKVEPELMPADLRAPMNPIRSARLASVLEASFEDTHVKRVKLYNSDGRVVFANDPAQQGKQAAVTGALRNALRGDTVAGIEEGEKANDPGDESLEKSVEVYVPLRFGDRVAGAFELYVPYATVAARGEKKIKRTIFILLDGLVLLWAALFRLVAGASRRLRNQAEENRRLAREDALTGLANRTSFLELAADALAKKPRHAAVLLLDLDRFKDLNDSLGHHAGDLLLREIGPRLTTALPEGAVIARQGGDEFVALISPLSHPDEARAIAEAARAALAHPVEIQGIAVSAEGSVGIAHYPDDGTDVSTLLQRADVAMYEAKEKRTGVADYKADADRSSHERLLVLAQLREAIERDELVLHYQPKVSLKDGSIVGAEALVRWQHPERGLVPPMQFVPLAEHTGLIGPLTAWVLTQALTDTRRWWDRGRKLSVAVNLSVANLVDPELPGLVAGLLAQTRLPPSALEFEITESVLMTEPERALRTLKLLRSMGVRLAVDDYGTGHSSLAYLHQLPLNTLKIDRSFVSEMAGEGGVIVRSTVDLAHSLGLDVVAEGIEDHRTAIALRAVGCDLGQGFHYARPVPVEDLMRRFGLDPETDDIGFTATVVSAFPEIGEHREDAAMIAARGGEFELVEDPRDVLLDGAERDDEGFGDPAVGPALGDEPEHLELTRRQL
jgi:diguanylate cyclase (GGDEF)-like protein